MAESTRAGRMLIAVKTSVTIFIMKGFKLALKEDGFISSSEQLMVAFQVEGRGRDAANTVHTVPPRGLLPGAYVIYALRLLEKLF